MDKKQAIFIAGVLLAVCAVLGMPITEAQTTNSFVSSVIYDGDVLVIETNEPIESIAVSKIWIMECTDSIYNDVQCPYDWREYNVQLLDSNKKFRSDDKLTLRFEMSNNQIGILNYMIKPQISFEVGAFKTEGGDLSPAQYLSIEQVNGADHAPISVFAEMQYKDCVDDSWNSYQVDVIDFDYVSLDRLIVALAYCQTKLHP